MRHIAVELQNQPYLPLHPPTEDHETLYCTRFFTRLLRTSSGLQKLSIVMNEVHEASQGGNLMNLLVPSSKNIRIYDCRDGGWLYDNEGGCSPFPIIMNDLAKIFSRLNANLRPGLVKAPRVVESALWPGSRHNPFLHLGRSLRTLRDMREHLYQLETEGVENVVGKYVQGRENILAMDIEKFIDRMMIR